MTEWYVTPEYHLGEKIFAVVRDDQQGRREMIGTFDDRKYAQEFATALNGRENNGSD